MSIGGIRLSEHDNNPSPLADPALVDKPVVTAALGRIVPRSNTSPEVTNVRRAFVLSSLLVIVACEAANDADTTPNMADDVPTLDGDAIAQHMRTLSSDENT